MPEPAEIHRSGSGPPLVFVHGVGLDHTMWDLVVDRFADGHSVIRYDLLGHGTTPDPDGPRSLDDFVAQLASVIRAEAGGNASVVGSSLGALIALATAARHPELVQRLVTANIIFGRTPEQLAGVERRLALTERSGMGPVAELAIDRWFSPEWQAAHPDLVTRVADRLRTNDVAAYLKAYRVLVSTDLAADGVAQRVSCPTLAVTGELDPGSTPAMTRALGDALPDGDALVLDGLRHLPSIEAPERFIEAVLGFVTQSTGR